MPDNKILDDVSAAMNAEELERKRSSLQIPVIDLEGLVDGCDHKGRRAEVVDQIRRASEKWGLFQVVNHGFPLSVIDGILAGVRKFHEQDAEMKKDFYSTDVRTKVRYSSNSELYFKSKSTCLRDTLVINHEFVDYNVQPQELPAACRDGTLEFINLTSKLGDAILKLLAEALGLEQDHLIRWGCGKGRQFLQHYYPPWPAKDTKLGTNIHTDTSFITILLQDQNGGLQILYNNKWLDVHPVPGAITVNLGDFFKIISNGKFESVVHRVICNQAVPRASTICFFQGDFEPSTVYSPIQELISEENPPQYKAFTVQEYLDKIVGRPRGNPTIGYYEIKS